MSRFSSRVFPGVPLESTISTSHIFKGEPSGRVQKEPGQGSKARTRFRMVLAG